MHLSSELTLVEPVGQGRQSLVQALELIKKLIQKLEWANIC